ncbi:hypothetical protein [Bradyrhizobium sp.]|uniref:hypothetical protein n=1 Tax=Bradyrhizobium sp. TaxID=376 RepID=UPI002C71F603|nr:hypothetical protein [Bradyrhizobium sp.]HMM92630.1 type II toxin-antitoxin system RelE/ParE family toxin [Bradyrhizobium sp.]
MPQASSFSYYGERCAEAVLSDVRDVYENGSPRLKARTLSRLKILAGLPRTQWHEGYFKKLTGPCEGLWEIRFEADNVQQRPLGFHVTETEFVILYWAREKGGKFVPKTACEIALKRKAALLKNGNLKHALWLALE